MQITLRVLAAIFGAWACTWAVTAGGVALLVGVGVDFHPAEQTMTMAGLLLFLVLFLWVLVARSLRRVGWVLALGTALPTALAMALQSRLVA
ncbi:MAG: hypothetical protein RL223_2525 [Pseudomonadota bacterium]|jgi:hypothetical protein